MAAHKKLSGNQPYHIIEGKIYPRVSSIAKMLEPVEWSKRNDTARREAAETGTRVHSMIAQHLKGKEVKTTGLPYTTRTAYEAFLCYEKERGVKPVHIELGMHVEKPFAFAGSADLIEEEVLTDWKTSRELVLSARGQVLLYITLYRITHGILLKKGRLVRLDKNLGTYNVEEFDIKPEMLPAALGLVEWFHTWKDLKRGEDYDREVTYQETGAKQVLEEPKVSDDRAGEDRKVGLLESGTADSVSRVRTWSKPSVGDFYSY